MLPIQAACRPSSLFGEGVVDAQGLEQGRATRCMDIFRSWRNYDSRGGERIMFQAGGE